MNHMYKQLTLVVVMVLYVWLSETPLDGSQQAGGLWWMVVHSVLVVHSALFRIMMQAICMLWKMLCRLSVYTTQWFLVNMKEVLVCCDGSTTVFKHQQEKASHLTLHSFNFTMIHLYRPGGLLCSASSSLTWTGIHSACAEFQFGLIKSMLRMPLIINQ